MFYHLRQQNMMFLHRQNNPFYPAQFFAEGTYPSSFDETKALLGLIPEMQL